MSDLLLALLALAGILAPLAALWLVERPRRVKLDGSLWGSECPRKDGPDA